MELRRYDAARPGGAESARRRRLPAGSSSCLSQVVSARIRGRRRSCGSSSARRSTDDDSEAAFSSSPMASGTPFGSTEQWLIVGAPELRRTRGGPAHTSARPTRRLVRRRLRKSDDAIDPRRRGGLGATASSICIRASSSWAHLRNPVARVNVILLKISDEPSTGCWCDRSRRISHRGSRTRRDLRAFSTAMLFTADGCTVTATMHQPVDTNGHEWKRIRSERLATVALVTALRRDHPAPTASTARGSSRRIRRIRGGVSRCWS